MTKTQKTSLRQQFDEIKEDMERLKSEGKISSEAMSLMRTMVMLFEIVIAAFLEKKVKKTSRNSSIPSSQVEKDNTAPKTGSHGKGRDGNGLASNFREVKTQEINRVECCPVCATDLGDIEPTTTETRTKIDIIFEKHVHEVTVETKCCPLCKTTTKADFPEDMPGPLQYGAGLKSFIVNLIVAQMVPLKRCQQLIKSMIDQVLSESTLVSYVAKLGKQLAQWEAEAVKILLKSPVLHVDETSMRVDRKKYWVHVHTAGAVTVKMLHPKRGKAAITDNNVIPRYGGIIVHDCWASYLSYDHCGQGLCGAHLLRELAFVEESNGYRWAKNMKMLLLDTCRSVASEEKKKLSETDYASLQRRYRNTLTRGANEMPLPAIRESGQRGRVAKSDAHNLLEHLLKQAKFKINAHLNEIEVGNKRGLNKQNIASILTLDWFHKHRNIIVTGPTGCGKTYLACAIGRHLCQSGYSARYFRASRLLAATTIAHAEGHYLRFIASIEKVDLLIIDDWGLEPLSSAQRHDLLEILEDRHNRKSTIFLSQIPVDRWHDYINDATLADAILDRVVHNAFQLKLKGDSMRKLKNGLAEGERLG